MYGSPIFIEPSSHVCVAYIAIWPRRDTLLAPRLLLVGILPIFSKTLLFYCGSILRTAMCFLPTFSPIVAKFLFLLLHHFSETVIAGQSVRTDKIKSIFFIQSKIYVGAATNKYEHNFHRINFSIFYSML